MTTAQGTQQPSSAASATKGAGPANGPVLVELPSLGMTIANINVVSEPPVVGSPAEKMGLRVNDFLLRMNGQTITDVGTFISDIAALTTRSSVRIAVRRGNEIIEVPIMLDNWATTTTVPAKEKGRLGLPVATFIVVQKVNSNSTAQKMGFNGGEVIMSVNSKSTTTSDFVAKEIAPPSPKRISLLYRSGRDHHAVLLTPGGDISFVPEDTIYATRFGVRAISALSEEARRDDASAAHMVGQKYDMVGIVTSIRTIQGNVVISFDNSTGMNGPSDDSLAVTFKEGPLADAVGGLKRGDVLLFRGAVTSAKREEAVQAPQDLLDWRPGTPKPKAKSTLTMYWNAEALLPSSNPQ